MTASQDTHDRKLEQDGVVVIYSKVSEWDSHPIGVILPDEDETSWMTLQQARSTISLLDRIVAYGESLEAILARKDPSTQGDW